MNKPLRGISSLATRAVLSELSDAWRQHTGRTVQFESVGGVDAANRIRSGEAFDVAVLASDAIDTLCAARALVPSTKTNVVRSRVAIAVLAGAPKPAVATESQLRESVLMARSIGYSTGPSGVALLQIFERWGITPALRERLVQAPTGTPVATLIASGQVELGFQQLSELAAVEGIDVVGSMPAGVEIITTFSAARCSRSPEPQAVGALLEFIGGANRGEIKRRHHMLEA